MTIRISKPEFNLREKLNELDYSRVPYEKMPAGSIIQIHQVQRATQLTLTALGDILETTFTHFKSDSRMIIDIRLRAVEHTGNTGQWYVGLKKTIDGVVTRPGGHYQMHSYSHPDKSQWIGYFNVVVDSVGSNDQEITYTLYAGRWGSNNGTVFSVNRQSGDSEVYGAQLIIYEIAQ